MLKRTMARLLRNTVADRRVDAAVTHDPANCNPDLLQLTAEIRKLAPNTAAQLLVTLGKGLAPQAEEFDRYLAAEALAAAVYPKYKFSEFGRSYLEDEAFLNYYTRFMDPGNWHSLDRKYLLNELLKQVQHIEGDIAECGAYKGASAFLMCRALSGASSLVHLFDSFEGLAEPLPIDGSYWRKGSLSTGEQILRDTLVGFENYRVYKGWIPERFQEVDGLTFRFVHIDVDLFEPTRDSLEFFYPRVATGGMLLLDDHGFRTCPGATKAAEDFFADKPEQLSLLPTGQAFTIKQ
jgi:O-methyltransferase